MALENEILILKNSFPYDLLSYWNLVKKSDNFPKRGYGNVVTRTPEKILYCHSSKNYPCNGKLSPLKKTLTKSSVMKIGCKIP
jgi:hypothetical protein